MVRRESKGGEKMNIDEIIKWVMIVTLVVAAVLYVVYPQKPQDTSVLEKWRSQKVIVAFIEAETYQKAEAIFYKEFPDYLIVEHEKVKGGYLIKAKRR